MPQEDSRICVIGAGSAGLSAAYYLKRRGYKNVVVLEKSDRMGGKCMSFDYEGHGYDMGFHEMGGGYYDVTQLAREVNVETGGKQKMMVFDRRVGRVMHFREFAKAQRAPMIQQLGAMLRYVALLLFRYRSFQKPGTGLANSPADLRLPIVSWMNLHRLHSIQYIFSYIMRNQGYGSIDNLTAGYWVKFQGLATFITVGLAGMGINNYWPRIFPKGSEHFWNVVGSHLDVRLNHKVEKVRRYWRGENFVIEVSAGDTVQEFDELIVATEVDEESLGYLDRTEDETRLFSQIKYDDIWSTAAKVEGVSEGIVTTIPVPEVGGFTGYIKDSPDKDMAIFYSLTEPGQDATIVNERIVAGIESMPRRHGRKASVEMPPVHQHHWKKYFPHVTPSAWAENFYERMEALQGQQHTHFVGGAFSFELLGATVSYSKRLVYFQFPDFSIPAFAPGLLVSSLASSALMIHMIFHFAKISLPIP